MKGSIFERGRVGEMTAAPQLLLPVENRFRLDVECLCLLQKLHRTLPLRNNCRAICIDEIGTPIQGFQGLVMLPQRGRRHDAIRVLDLKAKLCSGYIS